jgi:hypothetical protein
VKHFRGLILTGICVISLVAVTPAQEKKVKMSDLPPAVQKTVKEQSQGATIRGLTREVENGKTQYEAELTVNGHSKDLTIDSDGNVVEVEEQVALGSLPEAVQKTIRQTASKGRILKVESVSRHGTLAMYEAVVVKGGKKSEIQVGTDGKLVPKGKS